MPCLQHSTLSLTPTHMAWAFAMLSLPPPAHFTMPTAETTYRRELLSPTY